MADARTATLTSPGPGYGTGMSSIHTTSGPPNSENMAAFMVVPLNDLREETPNPAPLEYRLGWGRTTARDGAHYGVFPGICPSGSPFSTLSRFYMKEEMREAR